MHFLMFDDFRHFVYALISLYTDALSCSDFFFYWCAYRSICSIIFFIIAISVTTLMRRTERLYLMYFEYEQNTNDNNDAPQ